jgi:murein DD-endopeptidase MepM/ murein hydrolase activator NlpD
VEAAILGSRIKFDGLKLAVWSATGAAAAYIFSVVSPVHKAPNEDVSQISPLNSNAAVVEAIAWGTDPTSSSVTEGIDRAQRLTEVAARKLTFAHAGKAQKRISSDFAGLKRLLAANGIDLDKVLSLVNPSPGEGGPFIALNDPHVTGLNRQQLGELRQLANELPLAAPLDQYELGSPYGARTDPINHRAAFHPGLDMDAPYRSPVYSAGAGTVSFVGNISSYGRVVEIDHGHGIFTRYAHLHRALVTTGQSVEKHSPIAELGSTGRTTAPHLHYEVRVDGAPIDPETFIRAGANPVSISALR